MIQTDHWRKDGDDYSCEIEIESEAVPMSITGVSRLSGDDEHCVNEVVMTLKSSVPLLGGQLEKFAAKTTRQGLVREYEYTRSRLE